MAEPQKTRYHHGNLAEALMEAGEAALNELGAHKLTLRECARRAGVSHAAPTHHFGNRTQFLSALAERGYRRLARVVIEGRAAVDPEDLDAQLLATAEAYVGFAQENPELFRLMFRIDLLERCESGVEAAQARFDGAGMLASLYPGLSRLVTHLDVAPDAPERIAQAFS